MPLAILLGAVVLCGVFLALPLSAPIGSMYWDVFLYYDAANRMFSGQLPVVDFFTPVGPLGYYLFTGLLWLFPNAQPSLIAPWSILIVSAPLMALVLRDVGGRSRGMALALLVPFLLFSLLPFNTREFYPLPGSDAFGIYNRQTCQLLYVLVAGLMFVRDRRVLLVLVTLAVTALFFLKITGFLAAGVICAFALLTGRVSILHAIYAALGFFALCGLIELTSGTVSMYVRDILLLVDENSGSLLSRIREAIAQNFDIAALGATLFAVLAWIAWRGKTWQSSRDTTALARAQSFFDLKALWFAAVLFAAILFETQNTGSQGFIFLWPVLLAILMDARGLITRPMQLLAVAGLALAIALPPAVSVLSRAARTYLGGANNPVMAHRNLKTLGAVNMRPEIVSRVEHMLKFYPEHRGFYEDMVEVDEAPTPLFYSDFDFQIVYLRTLDKAIDAILALEAAKGVRFETIMSLNFVNPVPWLMDRQAPLHISIGADPMRTVPVPGPADREAVAATDLVLYPTCPPTINVARLHAIYAEALTAHKRIVLDECTDAFVNPKFAAQLGLQ